MKHASTLFLTLLALPAFGQEPRTAHQDVAAAQQRAAAAVNHILQSQTAAYRQTSPHKTASQQRLVARSYRTTGTGLFDSLRYFYSTPLRGAFHDPKNPESYADNFRPLVYSPLHGNENGYFFRRQYIQHDSMVRFQFAGTLPIVVARASNRYDSLNRAAERTIRDAYLFGGYRYRFTLAYDAAGNNVYCQRAADTGHTAIPAYIAFTDQYSTYDAAGRVLQDSQVSNTTYAGTRYRYDYAPGGQLLQILEYPPASTMPNLRLKLTYNAAGLLESAHFEEFGNGWRPWVIDSFAYSGTNPAYTSRHSKYWDLLGERSESKTVAHLNAAGNWDTLRHYWLDTSLASGWQFSGQEVIAYNAAGNWDRQYFYADSNNDNIPDVQPGSYYQFYYEGWGSAAAVAETRASEGFRVYPNPTGGAVWVEWTDTQPSAPARYRLTNAAGRSTLSGSFPQAASRAELRLEGLPPGLYILSLTDARGATIHRQKLLRQ